MNIPGPVRLQDLPQITEDYWHVAEEIAEADRLCREAAEQRVKYFF